MKMRPLVILLSIIAFILTGCATSETEDTTESWAEEMTPAQAISVMPVTVDWATPATAQPAAIRKMNALQEATSPPEQAIKVEWRIPKVVISLAGISVTETPWEIYGQNADGGWDVLSASVMQEEIEDSITGEYYLSFTALIARNFIWFQGDMLATLKVLLPDHNTGVLGESIVTFMVAPEKALRVELVEASAKAPSKLFGQFASADTTVTTTGTNIFNWTTTVETMLIFQDLQGFAANGVDVPTMTFLESQLPAYAPIKFYIETDFSAPEWGFENTLVTHESNSSYCKVTQVKDGIPEDTQWRFKYAFEDLPLEKAAFEGNGMFDYNDVILHVDVLK